MEKPRKSDRPRSDLNRPWARIAKHAGLEGVRIHDLRHSFASVAMGSGMGESRLSPISQT
jgi:integrase